MAKARTVTVKTAYEPGDTAYDAVIDALEGYRERVEGGLEGMTDEEMLEVLVPIGGQGPKVEEKRVDALVAFFNEHYGTASTDDDEGVDVAIVPQGVRDDMAIGALFDKPFNDLIVSTQDKREEADGSIMYYVKYIDENKELAVKLDDPNYPKPGTRNDVEKTAPNYSDNPDIHKGVSNKVGNQKQSHYQNIIIGSSAGATMNLQKLIISRLGGEGKQPEANDKELWNAMPNVCNYSELENSAKKRAAWKARANKRLNNATQKLRTAQSFRLNRAKLKKFSHLAINFVSDDINLAHRNTTPILVVFTPAPGKTPDISDPYSFGSFNRWNVDKAAAAAKTEGVLMGVGHLKATVNRSPGGKNNIPGDPTTAEALSMIASLSNYVDKQETAYTKRMSDLVEALAASDSDDDVENFGDVASEMELVFNRYCKARYAAIKARRRKATEPAAAEGNGKPDLQAALKASLAKGKAA